MVSVAEQFSSLRQTLGSVLGIFTILRWARTLIAKITGRPPPADATSLTPAAFAAFTGASPPTALPDGRPAPPKPSKKPFIVFLLAVFGLPYLMGKLIRALAKSHDEAQQAQAAAQGAHGLAGGPPGLAPAQRPIDPANLDFCKVLYDFPPADAEAAGAFDPEVDLRVAKGDLVAVLDKTAPGGEAAAEGGAWWRCRARDGRMGYLPAVYLQTIAKRPAAGQRMLTSAADGAAGQTLADVVGGAGAVDGRARTMPASVRPPGEAGKEGDGAERVAAFQKGWVGGS